MTQRALITGITGQDGSYLAELLLGKGYDVHGIAREGESSPAPRLEAFRGDVTLHRGDLRDPGAIGRILDVAQPEEIYNLAGMSSVAASWGEPVTAAESTAVAVTRMLEAVRQSGGKARFYQASSSEMFGKVRETPQRETTPFYPRSPYAVAKAYGHFITINYRESHDLYACSGILFNHESPRRGGEFVTRKITRGAAAIKLGRQDQLVLGNTDARRDWGHARDYVEAMWLMLQQDTPDDFVIGTGVDHSVRDVVDLVFEIAGLDPEEHVTTDPGLVRPAEVDVVVADASKARERLGWESQTSFEELMREMFEADLALLEADPPITSASEPGSTA